MVPATRISATVPQSAKLVFEQFYLGCLAHASYLVGSDGLAVVVDPQRDVDIYIETARKHGLNIAWIIETHLHADFVSGHLELAERTGATICLGEGSGATFLHQPVGDGHSIEFGSVRLVFRATPGHTPESVCIVLTDSGKGPDPHAVFTGDTLFIGDVGRPDLSDQFTPQQLASLLYDSLHNCLLALPDETLVYPAHGAGSMCGRNISADRTSTIGRERRTNYALQPMSREAFVELLTADLPPRPEYFQQDVQANRTGAPALAQLPPMQLLNPAEVAQRQLEGTLVLDVRPGSLFGNGFVPGSVNIGLGGQFAAWAGAIIGLNRDVILVAEDSKAADESRMRLARVGIDRVVGILEDGILGWVRAARPLALIEQITAPELSELLHRTPVPVIDVRRQGEWNHGHLPHSQLRPLDDMARAITTKPDSGPTVVHCQSGYRSIIACSLLAAAGYTNLLNLQGGYDAWSRAGLPTEQETEAP